MVVSNGAADPTWGYAPVRNVIGTFTSPTTLTSTALLPAPADKRDILIYVKGDSTLIASTYIGGNGLTDGQMYCVRGTENTYSPFITTTNNMLTNGSKSFGLNQNDCYQWDNAQGYWIEVGRNG